MKAQFSFTERLSSPALLNSIARRPFVLFIGRHLNGRALLWVGKATERLSLTLNW